MKKARKIAVAGHGADGRASLSRRKALLVAAGLAIPSRMQAQAGPLTVFAAISLREVLDAIGRRWQMAGHAPIRFAYAASGALARQIEFGAPADLFVAADQAWFEYLVQKGFLAAGSGQVIARNKLVLVARQDSGRRLVIGPGLRPGDLLGGGSLAMGDPASVPAGAYGKAALESLGIWADLQGKLIRVENVRAALALVARGEVGTGIVYASDAQIDSNVRIIAEFPLELHPPIEYPAATLTSSQHKDAKRFLAFLLTEEARAQFRRLGFEAGG